MWRRRGRPRAVPLPRVQRSPLCWTYHKPAPFSCSRRPKPQHRQDRRGGAASKRRPNIDNVDNMDTDGRRVEAIPHEQEKQTTPNIDNVDNRTQTRPPLCVRICPVVCPYLQRTPKPPPAPNRGIYRQTPRRGGAAFTPARYEQHRQRGQSLNRRKENRPRYGQI